MVVTVSIADSILRITETGIGSANITLTATNESGFSANDIFMVSVSDSTNNIPYLVNPIDDMELQVGFSAFSIDISNVFIDVDGDVLSYSVENDNELVVQTILSGINLLVFEEGVGSANIKLKANDGKGGLVQDNFIINVNTVSNIEENSYKSILIYPNPAKDRIFIESPSLNLSDAIIEIYDVTGNLRLQQKLNSSSEYIDLSQLSASTYFIRINQNDRVKVLKFIKQ